MTSVRDLTHTLQTLLTATADHLATWRAFASYRLRDKCCNRCGLRKYGNSLQLGSRETTTSEHGHAGRWGTV
jgi:hypothetical protein